RVGARGDRTVRPPPAQGGTGERANPGGVGRARPAGATATGGGCGRRAAGRFGEAADRSAVRLTGPMVAPIGGGGAPGDERLRFKDFEFQRLASGDRKSTRLNSSHQITSYAVLCLKNKKLLARHARASRQACDHARDSALAP